MPLAQAVRESACSSLVKALLGCLERGGIFVGEGIYRLYSAYILGFMAWRALFLLWESAQPALHSTRLRLGQIAARGVARVVLVSKAQSQTRLAGELVR